MKIAPETAPYNPLDLPNLARSVRSALEDQPLVSIGAVAPFTGAGVYALYYSGRLPIYKIVAKSNARVPIYVGKSEGKGGRKGTDLDGSGGNALYSRIRKHFRSISDARNLEASDFSVRFLVTFPVFVPLTEWALVSAYRPLWNVVIDGFGNNPVGKGRSLQAASRWDILHPGRGGQGARESERTVLVGEIERTVHAHLKLSNYAS